MQRLVAEWSLSPHVTHSITSLSVAQQNHFSTCMLSSMVKAMPALRSLVLKSVSWTPCEELLSTVEWVQFSRNQSQPTLPPPCGEHLSTGLHLQLLYLAHIMVPKDCAYEEHPHFIPWEALALFDSVAELQLMSYELRRWGGESDELQGA